jgi:hypothetical protein
MPRRIAAASIAVLASAGIALACGGAPICTVADPTGTPLNIRLSPNGPVVGTATNGTELMFVEHREVDGQLWALVERFHEGEMVTDFDGAWVFGAYLDCADGADGASRKSPFPRRRNPCPARWPIRPTPL